MVVLEVAGEQDALPPHAHGEHDGGAVDGPAVGQHAVGESVLGRPQDVDASRSQAEGIALGEARPGDAPAHGRGAKLEDAAALGVHLRLEDAIYAVARREPGQPPGVVLVRVGQQRHVDVSVPGRDALVEPPHEEVGVGAAVDEEAATIGGLEQDGVTLSDVEHADGEGRARPGHQRDGGDGHQ